MGFGKRLGPWASFALALFAAFLAFGCGGGGGVGALGGTDFFLSDAPASDYDQVWVRLFKIEAVGGGGSRVVFENPQGEVIDVASLNDGSARFAYLGSGELPSGTTSLRIELDSQVTLLPAGEDQAEVAVFNSSHASGNGHSTLSVPFSPPPGGQVVIDFDLSAWQVNNGVVDPVVQLGSTTGLDVVDRQEERLFFGTVSNLEGTAPDQTFTLTTLGGRAVLVATSDATLVFDENGAGATLAAGQSVAVLGMFSLDTDAFVAGSIQILGGEHDPHFMLGRAFDPNLGSGTFLCEVKRVHGFVPNHRIVTVSTPEHTVFLAPSGEPIERERFYEAIEGGDKFVIAAGHYDGATNLFTARVVKLHHRHHEHHEERAVGPILELMPDLRAFVMRPREWSGHENHEGERIKVLTGAETAFFGPDGAPITAHAFFNEAQPGTVVLVEGTYFDHVIRAHAVKVVRWDSTVEFVGFVAEWSFEHKLIVLEVPEGNPSGAPDTRVRVKVHLDTQLFIGDGLVDVQVFFGALTPGLRMGVRGWFDGEFVHAGSCRLLQQ
jgi:hypothetical protein